MEKMSAQAQRSPSTVPLARDAEGNPIELPHGTVGWRVRRQTGGRPRLVLDSRKVPMTFPLDYTIADAEDILPPGNYLLDGIDERGEPTDVTVPLSIGVQRNAEAPEDEKEADAVLAVPMTLPSTTNEMRLVLEANVRATQMAFLHNQRTLELGLRMAETLKDGVQVLANAQADWIKSVSSARGFFRNAGQPLAPIEVKQLTVTTGERGADEGDDEEDDGIDGDGDGGGDGGNGGGTGTNAHWMEQLMPIIQQLATQALPAIGAWSSRQKQEARGRRAGTTSSKDGELIEAEASGAEVPSSVAQQPADTAEPKSGSELAAAIAAAASPGPGINLLKLFQLLPQRLSAKLMQLQGALSPDEQADAMRILQGYSAADLEDVLGIFDAASPEECLEFMRKLVAELRRVRAGAAGAENASRPGGTAGSGSGEPR